ncbi:MAG: YraN family protein, partial [Acetobacteraceae bacterium]|nr:YraN family protein [Acetobacteraceae bacterium]
MRGARADAAGRGAEDIAAAALVAEGWAVLARRVRTPAGEIDMIAERDGLLTFIEVKARPSFAEAAFALGAR